MDRLFRGYVDTRLSPGSFLLRYEALANGSRSTRLPTQCLRLKINHQAFGATSRERPRDSAWFQTLKDAEMKPLFHRHGQVVQLPSHQRLS